MTRESSHVVVRTGEVHGYTFRVMMSKVDLVWLPREAKEVAMTPRQEVTLVRSVGHFSFSARLPVDAVLHITVPWTSEVYEICARFARAVRKPTDEWPYYKAILPSDPAPIRLVDYDEDPELVQGLLMPKDSHVRVELPSNDLTFNLLPWNDPKANTNYCTPKYTTRFQMFDKGIKLVNKDLRVRSVYTTTTREGENIDQLRDKWWRGD